MAMLGINHVQEMGPDLLVREHPHPA
jgi:hypothetical protein